MREVPRIHFNPILSPSSKVVTDPGPAPERAGGQDHRSIGSDSSLLSIGAGGSIASIGSAGAIGSIGSSGSLLSIGSAGSVLSIASVGSVLSVGSVGSIASLGSAFSVGAVGGWCQGRSRVVEATTTALTLGALLVAAVGRAD